MSEAILLKIVVVSLLLLLSGFFSGSETSFLLLGRRAAGLDGKDAKSLTLRLIGEMLRYPRRLLIAIVIGNGCVNIAVSVLAASLTNDAFSVWSPGPAQSGFFLKTALATALGYPLLLFLGEIVPKAIALRSPEGCSRLVAAPLYLFAKAIAPIRCLLERASARIVRLAVGASPSEESPMTEQEFRSLVDRSKEGGALRESEHRFIHNIFDFGETRVSELMTQRADMVCLPLDQGFPEVMAAVEQHHFSRVPIYEKDKDDIVGVLYFKDLLHDAANAARPEVWRLETILRKPYFIPQTKKANDLFRELRSNRIHMAIVVDEYGGVAGLVTMEDLLEGLFGEILDEYDPEEPRVRQVDEHTFLIPARMPIEDFNRQMNARLPEHEYETMGGMVFDLFGRLPSPGSKVSYMNHTFTVEKVLGTRILELRVRVRPEGGQGGGDSSNAPQTGKGG